MWWPRQGNENVYVNNINIFTMNISTLFEYHCHFYVFTLTSYTLSRHQKQHSNYKKRHDGKQRNRNPGLFTIPVTVNEAFPITIKNTMKEKRKNMKWICVRWTLWTDVCVCVWYYMSRKSVCSMTFNNIIIFCAANKSPSTFINNIQSCVFTQNIVYLLFT